MRLNILHLSDFHFRASEEEKCCRLGRMLAESTRDNRVDVIVFSGELVNSVDDSFDNAYNALIAPIQTQHGLSNQHVLVVPGNHDKRHTEHQWVTDRHYYGKGVEKDHHLSKMWLEKAEAQEHEKAWQMLHLAPSSLRPRLFDEDD